jgi:hypothetical protein
MTALTVMIPGGDSSSSVRERSEIREGFPRDAPSSPGRGRWWSCLVFGCLCLCPVGALAANWVELAATAAGPETYYDTDSFERINPELFQITIKWVHSEASRQRTIEVRRQSRLSVEGYEDLAYSVSSPVLDCWGKQSRSTGFVDYNSSGKEIGRLAQNSTWVPWAQRSPNTPDQELCRKFSNR